MKYYFFIIIEYDVPITRIFLSGTWISFHRFQITNDPVSLFKCNKEGCQHAHLVCKISRIQIFYHNYIYYKATLSLVLWEYSIATNNGFSYLRIWGVCSRYGYWGNILINRSMLPLNHQAVNLRFNDFYFLILFLLYSAGLQSYSNPGFGEAIPEY